MEHAREWRLEPETFDPYNARAMRNYIIKAGDDYLEWIERGSTAARRSYSSTPEMWRQVDGHQWCWTGRQKHATRFTWREARRVVWLKLKELRHDGLGQPTSPPRTNRHAFKLVRLSKDGGALRKKSKAANDAAWAKIAGQGRGTS